MRWMAWSGMSNLLCAVAVFCKLFQHKKPCSVGLANAMTRKACVIALWNVKKELLLLCGAEVSEMNAAK